MVYVGGLVVGAGEVPEGGQAADVEGGCCFGGRGGAEGGEEGFEAREVSVGAWVREVF